MKFKTTLIVFAVFLALLSFLFIFESAEKKGKEDEGKLVYLSEGSVDRVDLFSDGETITIVKKEDGNWTLTEPLETAADQYEAGKLADDFADLSFSRVVEEEPEDLGKYGIPQKQVTLHLSGGLSPIKILVGMENPLDKSFFAKREDESRVVLLPSSLKSLLDKKLFDFRGKSIFTFTGGDVSALKISAGAKRLEAEKKDKDWMLSYPVKSLAKESALTGIISSLSGLKATEFLSENKTDEDLRKWGLDKPGYRIELDLPAEDTKLVFVLNKQDTILTATTNRSTKIISVEDSFLTDLDKDITEFREKSVASFYSWEVKRLTIKSGPLDLALAKSDEGGWAIEPSEESASQVSADRTKVDEFIREVESLEAEEWIDPPLILGDYGLDSPAAEITILVEEDEAEKEITILVGPIEEVSGKAVVKNTVLDYLFRIDGKFLEKLPSSIDDWKSQDVEK